MKWETLIFVSIEMIRLTDSAKNAIIRMAARQAVALLISSVQCRADAASGSVAR